MGESFLISRQASNFRIGSSQLSMSTEQHSKGEAGAIENRVMKSFVSFGLALTAFSVASHAIELPLTYTSEDKSIVFKHTEDLTFSPKPLKTHDKEILFKSESIKGYTAGVTVRLIELVLSYQLL